MAKVEIYTKSWCPYSIRAKRQLDDKGVPYEDIDVTTDAVREAEMVERSGRRTVPQVFVDGTHVGGSDDLQAAVENGLLDRLLAGTAEGEFA